MIKIVLQPGGMCCLNVGDQAMLESAYRALRNFWPHAEIRVFTWAPGEIERTLPGAMPLAPQGRKHLVDTRLFGRLSTRQHPASSIFGKLEDLTVRHAPGLQALAARTKMKLRGHADAARIVSALQGADLFLFSGAGIVADPFASDAIECLEILHLARRFGARTALLGHMFGPVINEELKAVCRRVLPAVDLITVRERVTSLPFLQACGVEPNVVRVTGDETLPFLCQARLEPPNGQALGVNVRAASYSGIDRAQLPALRAALHRIASQLSAPLEPLAVAHHPEDNDSVALELLGAGANGHSQYPESPDALRKRIAACRLVITGSYHAAVFALAQGIPALGLVFSPYYEAKFKGLQDLFGPACRYVDGRQPGWDQVLQMHATDLWTHAPAWKDELWRAATQLAQKGRAAYAELRRIVEDPAATPRPAPLESLNARAASQQA